MSIVAQTVSLNAVKLLLLSNNTSCFVMVSALLVEKQTYIDDASVLIIEASQKLFDYHSIWKILKCICVQLNRKCVEYCLLHVLIAYMSVIM